MTKVLKFLFIILQAKDGSHTFNIYNPIGYPLLLLYAIIHGIVAGWLFIVTTFKGSVKGRAEYSVVLYMFTAIIILVLWLL